MPVTAATVTVIVDGILVLIALELLAAWLLGRRRPDVGRAPLLATLAAGSALVLALRAALAGAPTVVLAALTAAFLAHAAYLYLTLGTRR